MTKNKRYQIRNKATKTVRRVAATRELARDIKGDLNWTSTRQAYEIFDTQRSQVVR